MHFLLQFGKILLSSAKRAVETEGFTINEFWNICVLLSSSPGKFCLFMFQISPYFTLSTKLVLHLWPTKYQWV